MKETKNKEVVNVVKNFNDKITKIRNMVYYYELLDVIPDFKQKDSEEQKKIIEDTINFYLSEIKKMNNYDLIKKKNNEIEKVEDFFSYSNKKISEEECCKYKNSNDKFYIVEDNADYVVDNLINKLFRTDSRKLNLPIQYDTINEYGLSSEIEEKDTLRAFLWIILKLSVIYNFLKQE